MSRYPRFPNHRRRAALAAAVLSVGPFRAAATDIVGVMPAALDQPRVNAMIQYPGATPGTVTDPLYLDLGEGNRGFNIEAYLDTGASGVLISNNTSNFLTKDLFNPGVAQATYQNKPVIFQDVGVAGADNFHVTVPIYVSIAPNSNAANERIADAEAQLSEGNTGSFAGIDVKSLYTQSRGPIRAQVGPFGTEHPNEPVDNPLVSDLDIIGTPLMRGKVVVMDPKPVDRVFGGDIEQGFLMKTHVYDRGTPYRPATADDDPGIPVTNRTVKLSYGSFDAFTRTGALEPNDTISDIPPAEVGAYRPTLDHNPFIGPSPTRPAGSVDNTPGVKIAFNNRNATGSFLVDTGAAASMISTVLAEKLAVRIDPRTVNTDSPVLETFDPSDKDKPGTPIADQFALSIGGIGGTKKVPGFFLSSMLLRTAEGNVSTDDDAKHIRFLDAPVLVNDITVAKPNSAERLTLDGIFGMNNLVASLFLSEVEGGFPVLAALTPGAFDWAVVDFDETNPTMKLRPRLPGDANRDGTVNFADLVTLAQGYNAPVDGDPWAGGDFNGDGEVNFADLVMLAQHYNGSELNPGDVLNLPHYDLDGGLGAAAGVPEPASVLGIGLAAMMLGRRRPRRR